MQSQAVSDGRAESEKGHGVLEEDGAGGHFDGHGTAVHGWTAQPQVSSPESLACG